MNKNNIYLIIVILIIIAILITSILLILNYTKSDPQPNPQPNPPTPHTCDNKPQDFKCPPDNYDKNSKYTAICRNDIWTCVQSCPDKPDTLKCDNASCDESTGYVWKCNVIPDNCANKPSNFICPPTNSDNLSKYTSICDDTTNRNWICKKGCLDTDPDPDSCDVYFHRDCKDSTDYKWICIQDDKPTKCSDNPPDKLKCPTSDEVNYNKICNNQTGFEWTCQPSCKPNSTINCDTGQHPGCNIETDYKWKCVPDSSDVCGTTIKPSCSGAMCIDTDKGWDWKCPSDLSRDDIIKMHNLQCKDITNYDDNTNVNICFTDTNYKIPISPTIGNNCTSTGENHTFSIGKDLDNIINNPNGNITDEGKFVPFNIDKRLYYIPNSNKNETCILSYDKNYKCKNNGLYVQDKLNVTDSGKCDCSSHSCNNGTNDDICNCNCNPGWNTTKRIDYNGNTIISDCNSQTCFAYYKKTGGNNCDNLKVDCLSNEKIFSDGSKIEKKDYWYGDCLYH